MRIPSAQLNTIKFKQMKKLCFISILLLVISIIACKKEEVNNPEIDDVAIDFSVETTDLTLIAAKDLFIDGEAMQDFEFVISHPNNDPNQHLVDIRVYDTKYQVLKQSTTYGFNIVKTKAKDEFIKPIDSDWNDNPQLLYIDFIDGATAYQYGSADIGDQYIAMRKKNSGGGYYYGWMKINISNNGNKLEVKEYAFQKNADTPIKAGQK